MLYQKYFIVGLLSIWLCSSQYIFAAANAGAGSETAFRESPVASAAAGAGAGAGAGVSPLPADALSRKRPIASSEVTYGELLHGFMHEPTIDGHSIDGIEALFSGLGGVEGGVTNELQLFMPFTRWVTVTKENKRFFEDKVLFPGMLGDDILRGAIPFQLAYLFPEALGLEKDPVYLVIRYNAAHGVLPPEFLQDFNPYKEDGRTLSDAGHRYQEDLASLRLKFAGMEAVFSNPAPSREDLKFYAEYGVAIAQHGYAGMCKHGVDGDVELERARDYFERAARQGLKESQREYASMCMNGVGGDADLKEARKYFKLAANQRLMGAQHDYAVMCLEGLGGDADLREARDYFKRAAKQGLKESQEEYALMCCEGKGGRIKLLEAKTYFRRSAAQGNEQSKMCVFILCGEGERGSLKEMSAYFKGVKDAGHPKFYGQFVSTLQVNGWVIPA